MSHARFLASGAALLLVLASCGGGAASDRLSEEERADVERYGRGQTALQQALVALDVALEVGSTIDASRTAEENADAIAARAGAAGAACVSATAGGSQVTVDFGAPPGCAVGGTTISGTLIFSLIKGADGLTISLTLATLVVDGMPVGGTATLATQDGATFAVALSLTSDDQTVSGNLTVSGEAGTLTLSGTLGVQSAAVTVAADLSLVRYVLGDCYPSGGTVTLGGGRLSGTVTFLPTTPTDGEVTVTKERGETSMALPSYGACPPAPAL